MAQLGQGLEDSALSQAIKGVEWLIPLLQSIHIVTIGVVFVSSLMIALRVLGRMRADEPFAAVWGRFAPFMWGGLIVMAATGLILIVGEPVREVTALSFWLKMGLVVVAASGTAGFGRLRAAASFSTAAKTGAVALIVVWLAIIFLGRAIAYDTEVWGALSLHA